MRRTIAMLGFYQRSIDDLNRLQKIIIPDNYQIRYVNILDSKDVRGKKFDELIVGNLSLIDKDKVSNIKLYLTHNLYREEDQERLRIL